MIYIPDSIKELFLSDNISSNTAKHIEIEFFATDTRESYIVGNDRILSESLKIEQILSETEDIEFGSCNSAQLEIIVADLPDGFEDREFLLRFYIGEYSLNYGVYRVFSIKRQSDRRKKRIVAYDRMRKFDTEISDWFNSLVFPLSLLDLRKALCEKVGIQAVDCSLVNDNLSIGQTIQPSSMSGLVLLKAICQINGVFGQINNDGKFKFVTLPSTALYPSEDLYPHEEELFPSEYGGDGSGMQVITSYKHPMEYEDYLITGYDGLRIKTEDGSVGASVGNTDRVYTISNNFLIFDKTPLELLNIALSLKPYILWRNYRPCNLKFRGLPWLEVGDALVIPTRDDVIETICMKRILTGTQTLEDSVEATGTKDNEEKYTIIEKLEGMNGKNTRILASLDQILIEAEDVKEDTLSKVSTISEAITFEANRAKGAENEISANITVMDTELRSRVNDVFDELLSEVKLNKDKLALKVDKGTLSSELSLESDTISITSDRFMWDSTYSSLSEDGTLNCENIVATQGHFSGTIDGATIQSDSTIDGATIDGSAIYGSTITAPTITGGTIKGANFKSVNFQSAESFKAKNVGTQYIVCSVAIAEDADFNIVQYKYYFGKRSDMRFKEKIVTLDQKQAHDLILRLDPVKFRYIKSDINANGFIAQDVITASYDKPFKDALYRIGKESYYSIEYENYVGLLVASVQNLKNRIDTLRERKYENTNL